MTRWKVHGRGDDWCVHEASRQRPRYRFTTWRAALTAAFALALTASLERDD